ncbi:MAG: dihydropteroate synthase [Thermoplasmata archaeon]
MHHTELRCKNTTFKWGSRTYIMGILNVTPDSFSGDGITSIDSAVELAKKMVGDGADIIDVGGESSRPGAEPVTIEEEKERILPVIERLVKEVAVPISVDTYKSEVAKEALRVGANIVNDITGLKGDKNMAKIAAKHGVPVIIMHMKGTPKTMQQNPTYTSLIPDIIEELKKSTEIAKNAGIDTNKIIIDPGVGFGKTTEHCLQIIGNLREFRKLGFPILVGTSRKSFIGNVLNLPVEERLEGTAATVAISIANGADIVRVRDVKEMVRVVRIADAITRR